MNALTQLKWKDALDVFLKISVIGVCAIAGWSMIAKSRATTDLLVDPLPLPRNPIPLRGAELKGRPDAPLVLIEYSDFECPFCVTFAREIMPNIEREFVQPGKIAIAFKHLPLTKIHPFAMRAATAAECARQQGKFWQMHDKLFGEAPRFSDEMFVRHATQIQLKADQFRACTDAGADQVRADLEEAKALGIQGTPTFLIGTMGQDRDATILKRLSGALPIAQFRAVLESVLASR